MQELHDCVEGVVTTGIRAYIGLLACGEKERSRRVLSDTMQISSIASGGPSARIPLGKATAGSAALARLLIFFTLRSLLASLLVLRATAYWNRVPALRDLQEACALLNRCLGEGIAEAATGESGALRDEVGEARRRLQAAERRAESDGAGSGDDEAAGPVPVGRPAGGPGSPGRGRANEPGTPQAFGGSGAQGTRARG
ncbi:MAG: hypothetical protein ACOCVW_02705 [bacterium]